VAPIEGVGVVGKIIIILGVAALIAAMWVGLIDASFVTQMLGENNPSDPNSPVFGRVADLLIGNMAVIIVGLVAWWLTNWISNPKNQAIVAGIVIGVLFVVAVLPNL
jgi:hypothetical protein